MKIEQLKDLICSNLENKTNEVKRVFHGRGNFYEEFSYLTVDSFDEVLFVCLFQENENEKELIELFKTIYENYNFTALVVQRRYLNLQPCEVICGILKEENFAIENGLKYKISFDNRNTGLFLDMKKGREFVFKNAKDKNVLNLFSYTCAFSVSAISGGAKKVVNVDMSKSALSTGRINHHLNNQDTKKVKFMPYNILKSWSRIKKEAPYDLIIIDPPSFQKGSFAATKDYEKIIKRLNELANKQCTILSCLNAPELDSNFIIDLFEKNASSFKYIKRLENQEEFKAIDEEKSLKNLVFRQ